MPRCGTQTGDLLSGPRYFDDANTGEEACFPWRRARWHCGRERKAVSGRDSFGREHRTRKPHEQRTGPQQHFGRTSERECQRVRSLEALRR